MTAKNSIEIHDCWAVTGNGIIAELEHHEAGLMKGVTLVSKSSGLEWTVKNRLIFNHTLNKQKRFPGETENIMMLSFKSAENFEKSSANILAREANNIFQYSLHPEGQHLHFEMEVKADPKLVQYYKDRAKEYDKLYARPDRQADLLAASDIFRKIFQGKNVLEIACGTGYWTGQISQTANTILATDINDAMIEVAQTRTYSPAPVTFRNFDFYSTTDTTQHESLFGGFIWSHILLDDLAHFIDTINSRVVPGGTVVFIDNLYVEGNNLPISETDEKGNTYQLRSLDNGTKCKVLKNFPTEAGIRKLLDGKATDIVFTALPYYWILEYKTAKTTVA